MVSVDQPASALDPAARGPRPPRGRAAARAHLLRARSTTSASAALGLRPGRMSYFAGRAAPMGPVGAGVVTATFYNFSPSPRRAHDPAGLDARLARSRSSPPGWTPRGRRSPGCWATGRGGSAGGGGAGRAAARGVRRPDARRAAPLYAGHADLPWPEEPLLAAVARRHAAARAPRRRAHRRAAARRADRPRGADHPHRHRPRLHRCRRPRRPAAGARRSGRPCCAALAERGLLDDAGLTAEGKDLRARVEAETDVLSAEPWLLLGRSARPG